MTVMVTVMMTVTVVCDSDGNSSDDCDSYI